VDLSGRLARAATRRVAVLLVEVPGWGRVRCAVQSELRARGWREATSAADADALVVCGRPGIQLGPCLELVWHQMSGPRARIPVEAPTAVGAALDQLLADLLDTGRERADASQRPAEQTTADGEHEQDEEAPDVGGEGHHDDQHHGEPEDDGEDRSNQEHGDASDGDSTEDEGEEHGSGSQDGGHEGMDHGGMDMPMPGGIPLAGEGGDRDGLDLDELHVPLGPVLPEWPAGLVVDCALQGDLVTAASARVLAGETPPAGCGLVHGTPADRLDRAARLLQVAGWEAPALAAARLRDRLLFTDAAEGAPSDLLREVERLAARVRRSRVLRWSLADVPGVRDRLLGWLAEVHDALTGAPTPVTGTPVESLGDLVVGQDLAAVRLLVAAADVDTAGLVRSGADLS
jgi:hypothetical protein